MNTIYLKDKQLLWHPRAKLNTYASAGVPTDNFVEIDGYKLMRSNYSESVFHSLVELGHDPIRIRTLGGRLKRPLYNYQVTAVMHMLKRNGNTLIADEMGLGKTGEAIAYMAIAEAKRTLMVVPANVKYQWEREVGNWLTDKVRTYVCSGQDFNIIDYNSVKHANVTIINYQIFDWWRELLEKFEWDLVIFDEAHKIKKTTCTYTQTAYHLRPKFKSVLCLTGTPLTDRTSDIFNVVNMADSSIFLDEFQFQQKYCRRSYDGMDARSVSTNTLELNQKLISTGVMIRRRKKDVYKEMPKVTRCVTPFDVSNAKLKQLENETMSLVKSGAGMDSKNFNQLRMKVQASFEHFKQEATALKLPLIYQWIEDYLEETDQKLLVAVTHKELCGRKLHQHFKNNSVLIDGDVTSKQKDVVKDKFINDPNIRLLIGNIGSVGCGTDGLQHVCSNMVICELPWNSADVEQLISRLDRNGQKETVSITFLMILNSIEDYLARTIDYKDNIASESIDGVTKDSEDTLINMMKNYKK